MSIVYPILIYRFVHVLLRVNAMTSFLFEVSSKTKISHTQKRYKQKHKMQHSLLRRNIFNHALRRTTSTAPLFIKKNNNTIKRTLSTCKCTHEDDHEERQRQLDLYNKLFLGNREFVSQKTKSDPEFFSRLASRVQSPSYMLIGCSDSRVPPDQLTMTQPGDIFIHRNVANLVVNTDLNSMSVLQYAVEVLKVRHVIVMGHYGCGGVRASMEKTHHGLIDKWLRNIKDVQRIHYKELSEITDFEERFKRLVELNVREQTLNLCKTSIIQKAWASGHDVSVHGWVCDIATGYIHDLQIEENEWKQIKPIYEMEFPTLAQQQKQED
jgi:carbonic anhydrase